MWKFIINAIGSICQAHFCTMATDTKEVKRCFYCGKEAKKTKRTIFCTTCKKNPKFSLPVEITPEELETQYKDVMVYCYNCGEELFKDDEVIMCPDGCGLIDITVDQASVSLNQERTVSEPQDNAKDTVSSPTHSESTSNPTGPGPPLEERTRATPQNKTTSFTESNDDTSRNLSLQKSSHFLQAKEKLAQSVEKIPTENEGN